MSTRQRSGCCSACTPEAAPHYAMTIYIAVFVALLLLREVVALEPRSSGVINRVATLLIGVFLAVLTAARIDTGTDFPTYEAIWDYSSTLGNLTVDEVFFRLLEPLFVFTNAVLKSIEPESWFFFFVYGIATIMLLHKAIVWFRANGPHAYLVYVGTFLLPYAFNGMRQALVMSMFLYALRYFFRRRTAMVVLWTVVACGFHLTGILIIVAYVVHRLTEQRELRLSRWFVWGALIASIIGIAGLGGRLFFTLFEQKAETYSELFNEGSSAVNVAVRLFLAGLLVYGASLAPPSRLLRQLLILYSLGLFIYLALSEFNVLATRFNMFYRMLEVILIPMLLDRLRGAQNFLLHAVFTTLMLLALVTIASSPDYDYQSPLGRLLF